MILQHPPPHHKFLHISAIVEIRAEESIKHSYCEVHLHWIYGTPKCLIVFKKNIRTIKSEKE